MELFTFYGIHVTLNWLYCLFSAGNDSDIPFSYSYFSQFLTNFVKKAKLHALSAMLRQFSCNPRNLTFMSLVLVRLNRFFSNHFRSWRRTIPNTNQGCFRFWLAVLFFYHKTSVAICPHSRSWGNKVKRMLCYHLIMTTYSLCTAAPSPSILGSLSKDVFERRTSTGNEALPLLYALTLTNLYFLL